jgi:hypothetical protein
MRHGIIFQLELGLLSVMDKKKNKGNKCFKNKIN